MHRSHSTFTLWPFDAFEQAHARALEELHVDVLTGARTIDDAREERFRECLSRRARARMSIARSNRAPTERPTSLRGGLSRGARHLTALKPRVRIAIVTNNLLDEQQAKITLCGFDWHVDALVASEVAGVQASLGNFRKRSRQWRVRRATR